MKMFSISLAVAASVLLASASAGSATSLATVLAPEIPTAIVTVQAQGTNTYRNRDREHFERPSDRFERPRDRVQQRRQYVDCHRDVRTHRIDGYMLTHRHVGDRCTVRTVNRSSQTIPRQ
jgi:hypothetical protein